MSTAFWSAARLVDGFFFCAFVRSSQSPRFTINAYLWLLSLLEELIFTLLLVTLLPGKVLLTSDLVNLLLVNTRQIDLVRCGDNVAGVDSAKRNTVNLEWASNEENTLGECLQEDDTLSTETTSEENEDSAGSEG